MIQKTNPTLTIATKGFKNVKASKQWHPKVTTTDTMTANKFNALVINKVLIGKDLR